MDERGLANQKEKKKGEVMKQEGKIGEENKQLKEKGENAFDQE